MSPCKPCTGTGTSCLLDRHDFAGPYVTAVGGTMGIPPASEIANPLSGGGFSRHFTAPDYQKFEVDTYVDTIPDEYDGLYKFVLTCCLA